MTHAHHWVIEEPQGAVSLGTCKTCGNVKEFKNWDPSMDILLNTEHKLMMKEKVVTRW